MFFNSFEKGCAAVSEPSSPGRGGSYNRFPVGMGEENQHIRIQLAVHKYNNSSNSSISARVNPISFNKHSFLKSTQKTKICDDIADAALKTEKKFKNHYEGVGNFPTVHLKKSAVRYRPIKKYNDVKVPYPELPVNRYLNNVPEMCTDLKTSTRSVLDVLQDMSQKRIHSKDENDYIKYMSRGLGGDVSVNGNTITKPLFIQKPKTNVVTKDSTTQTLMSSSMNSMALSANNSGNSIEASDPRAELRKKLAKLNNEISASLSSSMPALFAPKRKIDKISTAKEDKSKTDASAVKKAKLDNKNMNNEENINSKIVNGSKTNLIENVTKINRRSKPNEGNAISPNKDRLTTIFLDMENTSPKAQVFQNNSILNDTKNSFKNNEPSPKIHNNNIYINQNSKESETIGHKVLKEDLKNKDSVSSLQLEGSKGNENSKQPTFSLSETNNLTTATSNNNPSSVPKFSFGSSDKAELAVNNIANKPTLAAAINSKVADNDDKTDNKRKLANVTEDTLEKRNGETSNKPFAFNIQNNNDSTKLILPPFSPNTTITFKSDISTNGNPESQKLEQTTKETSLTSTTPFSTTVTSSSTSQFTFDLNKVSKPSIISPFLPTASTQLENSTTSSAITSSSSSNSLTQDKPQFQFNFQPDHKTTEKKSSKSEDNTETSKSNSSFSANQFSTTTTTAFGQSAPLLPFLFGQKSPNDEVKNKENSVITTESNNSGSVTENKNEANEGSKTGFFPTFQSPTITEKSPATGFVESSNQDASLSQNSNLSISNSGQPKSNSAFVNPSDQNTTTISVVTSKATEASSGQSKVEISKTFIFGQKSVVQTPPSEKSFTVADNKAKLFTFGQTSSAQNANQNSAVDTGTNSNQGNLFSQNVFKSGTQQPSNNSPLFSQNNGTITSLNNNITAFGQNQNSINKTTNIFGAKPDTGAAGTTSTTSIFDQGKSSFSSKSSAFGIPSSMPSENRFMAPSSQGGSVLGVTSFQTSTAFGIPNTTQSNSGFGMSSATQSLGFNASATSTTCTFGVPSTTQTTSTFGASTTQTTPSFGACIQSPAGFGVPSTPQISPFVQTFGQNSKPATQNQGLTVNNIFGQPSNIQSSLSTFTPSTTNFSAPAGQSIFGQKSNINQEGVFGQGAKIQAATFDNNSVNSGFNTPNSFSFGTSKANASGFTTSAPKTTASSVFTFGSTTNQNNFGSSSSTPSSSTPFLFSASSDQFKFGASSAKENSGFGSNNSTTFTFGGQTNNKSNTNENNIGNSNLSIINNNSNNNNNSRSNTNNALEGKVPAFSFGNSQLPSASTFNFSSTPSPSVFSFGGSGSGSGSSSSGSAFNFHAPQSVGLINRGTSSPSTFSAPGTFSIGSGSTQSKQRGSLKVRRRP